MTQAVLNNDVIFCHEIIEVSTKRMSINSISFEVTVNLRKNKIIFFRS